MIVAEQKSTAASPRDFDKNSLVEANEISELIDKATEIVLSQPMLLELYPPLNICGMRKKHIIMICIVDISVFITPFGFCEYLKVTYTDNFWICYGFSNVATFHLKRIICFWATMWTEDVTRSKWCVCLWHLKLNIPTASFYCVGITNAILSTRATVSRSNVSFWRTIGQFVFPDWSVIDLNRAWKISFSVRFSDGRFEKIEILV